MYPPTQETITVVTPSVTASNVAALLESLANQSVELEAIVVDNGSAAHAVSDACAGHDFARALRLEHNAGFSAAVNHAAKRAGGGILVLVNDDSRCDPGFVESLACALDPAAGVTMAAGVMRDARDEMLIETAGIEIDHTLLAFDYLNGEPLATLEDGVSPPLGPSGAAAGFCKEAFLEVGGFDERLFAYWEDTDLALRMRSRGWSCALARDALGTHAHSGTLGSGSARKNYLMGFGRGYVLRKWGALTPARLPAILARELPICAGQAAWDRNLAGIKGRAHGIRRAAPTEAYPAGVIATSPGGRSLARRARRRLRLRAS